MKFAKELEQDLVPEWRAKYLNYKQGKKHVKAITRAVARANATPKTPASGNANSALPQRPSRYGATTPYSAGPVEPALQRNVSFGDPFTPLTETASRPIPTTPRKDTQGADGSGTNCESFGSFVPTPPLQSRPFELPDPAVSPQNPLPTVNVGNGGSQMLRPQKTRRASINVPQNAYEAGETVSPQHRNNTFAAMSQRPLNRLQRIFSTGAPLTPAQSSQADVHLFATDQVRAKESQFFKWMDKELDKIDKFYQTKEEEAGARLKILREQLHEMRNRRIEELADIQRAKEMRKADEQSAFNFYGRTSDSKMDGPSSRPNSRDHLQSWLNPLERAIGGAKAKVMKPPGHKSNSRSLQNMNVSPELQVRPQPNMASSTVGDGGRDYVRRPHHDREIPYRSAKRKLKTALQELYRSMELLKSYSLLNRTGFRKINKKYDKAVDAHPPLRYMAEKVNDAVFVKSSILDSHMHDVEDLYARYFERGNHKIATGKLRSGQGRPSDQSASAFRNGVLIGTGAVFAVQGVIYGSQLLHHADPKIRTQASYLLQIYGGYFLALYLFSWFCLDCHIWTKNKINYQFVFEFDPRHNLDWRQLSEFPSFLILLLGLFLWINFSRYGSPAMFIYYPVILIFLTVVIIFIPAPILFHRSRRWFVYSHWRLLLAGLYPVEFRDFLLGDMYCSLTYFMSNIELFFCLYATYWRDPSQCNSSHSKLLGFFSTLPGIWRALQCVRRYYDTKNVFPHLVNCGKYSFTIFASVALSLYRIHRSQSMLALFCTVATVNSLYCSTWDLMMDWSLLQPDANRRFLRDVRGYKNTRFYYIAMALDPILRFNWIFYAIYTQDLQHNSICSFLVGLSEVTRRGMWTLLRVENEHCANVARFKASRDVPLPYDIESSAASSVEDLSGTQESEAQTTSASPGLSRLRTRPTNVTETSSLRNRRTPVRTFTKIMADAHTQDFEKKRKPGAGDSDNVGNMERDGSPVDGERGGSSSDEDDEEDEQVVLEAQSLNRERRGSHHQV